MKNRLIALVAGLMIVTTACGTIQQSGDIIDLDD